MPHGLRLAGGLAGWVRPGRRWHTSLVSPDVCFMKFYYRNVILNEKTGSEAGV